jgi:hypothetical protein
MTSSTSIYLLSIFHHLPVSFFFLLFAHCIYQRNRPKNWIKEAKTSKSKGIPLWLIDLCESFTETNETYEVLTYPTLFFNFRRKSSESRWYIHSSGINYCYIDWSQRKSKIKHFWNKSYIYDILSFFWIISKWGRKYLITQRWIPSWAVKTTICLSVNILYKNKHYTFHLDSYSKRCLALLSAQ